MTFPLLYHKAKTGKIHEWKIWTAGDTVFVEHGQRGGKKQQDIHRCTPKNVGKVNATTAKEQAESEAKSMWQHQVERKYVEKLQDTEKVVLLPMLAHKFLDEKKVEYPVYIQPKLEGVRCLAFWEGNRVKLLSRGGKEYKVPHIQSELEHWLPKEVMLDGEIYAHKQNQQTINSWVKKNQTDSKNLFYFVYDIPKYLGYTKENDIWENRLKALDHFFEVFGWKLENIKQVPTLKANHKEMVDMYHQTFVASGYEGIIVRQAKGLYEFGHRSHGLLKLKNFQDAEFTIIGAKGSKPGTDEEHCIVWVCQTEGAKDEFDVRPRGSHDERKELLKQYKKNPKKFIGKQLTVRFQEWTADKKPYFPVGISIRLSEDR